MVIFFKLSDILSVKIRAGLETSGLFIDIVENVSIYRSFVLSKPDFKNFTYFATLLLASPDLIIAGLLIPSLTVQEFWQ